MHAPPKFGYQQSHACSNLAFHLHPAHTSTGKSTDTFSRRCPGARHEWHHRNRRLPLSAGGGTSFPTPAKEKGKCHGAPSKGHTASTPPIRTLSACSRMASAE